MNRLPSSRVRRYRLVHGLFFACIPLAFLGMLLPFVLPPPPPDWLMFVPAVWFFGLLTTGALGMWAVGRRLLRLIDPDPETRQRIVGLSWLRPVGTFVAVNELLRLAEEK